MGWIVHRDGGVAVGITAVVLAVYVMRLLPGVGFSDTGVFQAAGPSLGITHPTGYPLFLILGKVFTTVLPLGSPAFEMNLLTASFGAAAAGLLYLIGRRFGTAPLIAAALPLVLAFSLMFWRTSTRADPHPLHAALVAMLILLAVIWRGKGAPYGLLAVISFLYGLSLGNHMLMLMMGPAIALFVVVTEPRTLMPRRLVPLLGAFLAGAAVYAYLPLRTIQGLPFTPTDRPPGTWDAFWNYILGGDFSGGMGFLSIAGPGLAADNLPRFVDGLAGSITPIGAWLLIGLAAIGAMRLVWTDRSLAAFLLMAAILPLYVALTYSNADIERYYFSTFAVMVLLAGIGAELLTRPSLRPARLVPNLRDVPPLLLLLPMLLVPMNVQRAGNISAECFLGSTLAAVDENAVIMAWWLNSTPLWYGVHAAGLRPDVDVINAADEVYELLPEYAAGPRPVYLVQPGGIVEAVSQQFELTEVRLECGDTIHRVTGRIASR